MTSRVAFALCLLLCLGGTSLAAEPSEPETAIPEEAGAGPAEDQSATRPDDETDDSAAGDETDKADAPMNVNRHRPGACPEGPPCKGEE
jgi:hypothetical protein